MAATRPRPPAGPRSNWSLRGRSIPHPARMYAGAMFLAYTTAGIMGLVTDPYLHSFAFLNTFEVNGPHSAFHLVIGIYGLVAIKTNTEFTYARLMSFVFAILSVCGFLQQPMLGIITLSGADMFLHGFTAILGDAVARLDEREILEEEIALLESEVETLESEVEGT